MKTQLLTAAFAVLVFTPVSSADGGKPATVPFPAQATSGSKPVAFTSNNIVLLGWLPLSSLDAGASAGSNCWGYTAPSGREYAIIGVSNGTAFVEITDPGKPDLVYFHPGLSSSWRELKAIAAGYAYVVSEAGDGIQVFDLTQIDNGVVTWVRNVTTGACTTSTHTISVNEQTGFLYRNGGSCGPCSGGAEQGLVIYNIANPSNPSFVAHWNTKYVHDSQIVVWNRAGAYLGKELAFCSTNDSCGGGTESITILDVTNKSSITTVKTLTYANSGFSHQTWLSADQRYLYHDDEGDDSFSPSLTRIFDVSNPASAVFVGSFTSGAASIDHNLYVKGNRIYEANYRSGLRVFDNTNPTAPVQIAWFDTYPDDDEPEFNSLWGNYPFYSSGTVIGSDIEKGLFVWRGGTPKLTFAFPNGTPDFIAPAGGKVFFEVHEETPGNLQGGSVMFHFSTGGNFTAVAAALEGPDLYSAVIPSVPCGTEISYYVSARSTGGTGVTWTDPPAGPTQFYSAVAAFAQRTTLSYDMETTAGWSVGTSTATTGIWTRVNPIGTAAQPEDDHTPEPGVFCWVTGQGPVGGSVGDNDVDNGQTTLLSPVFSASGLTDPYVSYWRWYSNNQGTPDDPFLIDISNNGGSTWTSLEVIGPTGPDAVGGWILHRARIASKVTPTANMRLRFIAQDIGSGSIVEAAIDDMQVYELICNLAINTVTPNQGPFHGGNTVTIVGQGFVQGLTSVSFEGRPSPSVTVISKTQLQAVVPPAPRSRGGKTGQITLEADVTVTTGVGSTTMANGYTYELPVVQH